jgi:hypothetical protein
MKLKINRGVWLRGEEGATVLLRSDGRGCIVGLYLLELGVDASKLLNRKVIDDAGIPEEARWIASTGLEWQTVTQMNDASSAGDEEYESWREVYLTWRFSLHAVELEFIG